jgi:hypothetical protein
VQRNELAHDHQLEELTPEGTPTKLEANGIAAGTGWGVETPVRDAFVDWTPRIIRTPAPPPRVRGPKPGELTRRLGRHEVVLRTGEVVTLLELLEIGLQTRGAGRRSPVRVLRDAVTSVLAERDDGSNDEDDADDDAPRR